MGVLALSLGSHSSSLGPRVLTSKCTSCCFFPGWHRMLTDRDSEHSLILWRQLPGGSHPQAHPSFSVQITVPTIRTGNTRSRIALSSGGWGTESRTHSGPVPVSGVREVLTAWVPCKPLNPRCLLFISNSGRCLSE